MAAPELRTLQLAAAALATGRAVVGLLPFPAVASARLLGIPAEHDSPTARLMGRMFGVRNLALAAMVLLALRVPGQLHLACLLNASVDAGDIAVILVPLLGRQGIDRAAWRCLAFALFALASWLTMSFLTRPF